MRKFLSILMSAVMLMSITAGLSVSANAQDYPSINLDEIKTATISVAGEYSYFTFTPEESGEYGFYSVGEYDTYGYIYDTDGNLLESDDDDGFNVNFCVTYDFTAGTTYILGIRFYDDDMTGSFNVSVHRHDFTETVVEPGCEDGYTQYECEKCGYYYKADWIEGTGHIPGEVIENVAPTCTESGYTRYQCTVCGDNFTDDWVDSLGHKAGTVVGTVNPTCVTRGYTIYNCARCNENYNDDYKDRFNSMGHTLINDVCTVCGVSVKLSQVIQIAESNEQGYVQFTPSESGLYNYYSICDYDTKGYIYDSEMNVLAYNDDCYYDTNFLLTYNLEAGKTYVFGAKFYYSEDTGNISVFIEKANTTLIPSAPAPDPVTPAPSPDPGVQTGTNNQVPAQSSNSVSAAANALATAPATNQTTASAQQTVTAAAKPAGAKKVDGVWVNTKQKKAAVKKLTKAKKAFKITWKKVSGVTGYQIQYSTSKKFTKKTTKSVTVSSNKAKSPSKTIKKLKSKKTYYVRIRTYKTVKLNGKTVKVYSSWSKAKTVTTKK